MRAVLAASLAIAARRALGVAPGVVESGDDSAVSLLQSRADVHWRSGAKSNTSHECGYLINDLGDPMTQFNNNEKFHSHKADFGRSIVEVMREHPGMDGYCYFNASAMYILYQPGTRDYVEDVRGAVMYLAGSGPDREVQNVTYHWEGPSVRTQAVRDNYLYDDLYAYSLGFLQGQGLPTALMFNTTAWEELSAQKCAEIQKEYNFSDDELIFSDLLNHNLPIMVECSCAAGVDPGFILQTPHLRERSGYNGPNDCRAITRREFAVHHYMKCVLGHKNSAADMAYLHARACLLEGDRIGHNSECPFDLFA